MATHSSILIWNPRDRGAWWVAVHGVAKSWTQLSTYTHILTCVRWFVIDVLIFFFLTISDVECLSIYLLAIHVTSLETCLSIYLCPFLKSGYLVTSFLAVEFMSSLYIFDINPLSDIWFANIFSCSVLPLHSTDYFLCYEKLFSLI